MTTPKTPREVPYWDDKWNERFIALAFQVSSWSKDPDRKVGAVIVSSDRRSLSYGYNGFPRSIEDSPERLEDTELKNAFVVHAELNAILNAEFNLHGSVLYVTQPPCHECVKALLQKGIAHVFAPPQRPLSKWKPSWETGERMMQEAKINQRFILSKEIPSWASV